MKPLSVFVVSMLLGAGAHAALSSCAQDELPQCPTFPRLPEKRSVALPIVRVTSLDGATREVESTIDLQGGTIEVTGEQVIVRYSLSGDTRTVVYDVLPAQ